MTPKQKACSSCREVLGYEEFSPDIRKTDGLQSACKRCGRERRRLYYAANRDACLGAMRRYQKDHSKKISSRKAKHYQKNKASIRARHRRYMRERLASDPTFRLAHLLRDRLRKALRGQYKTGSAVRDLGCSIPELRAHLESQFTDGMSWERRSEIHIDHIRPLASFDLTDRAQFLEACHYTNLRPLWAADNIAKKDKII